MVATDPEQPTESLESQKSPLSHAIPVRRQKKAINYVDDVVVAAEHMGELIRYLDQVFGPAKVRVAIFGHIGNGNAHVVPLLDVNDEQDFQRMVGRIMRYMTRFSTGSRGPFAGTRGRPRPRRNGQADVRRRVYGLFVQVKQAWTRPGF